ncbi:hypothetical protein [Desulfosoma caldarium]|uniref:Uncharacterized protein n=1 Tax=Desulfosoma caldarium TaxID=610254 RepID=A0A3N1UQI3_9BACT|nr:hypothetical protein [Desulfosoma caldarium]ROQ92343.1 hypothetical protein EDC27_2048 [Desulfosoma caldarium]
MMKRTGVLIPVIVFVSAVVSVSAFADHREKKEHQFFNKLKEHTSGKSQEDHGNENTGQMAAWLFAVANFPVAGTLLTRRFLLTKTSGNFQKTAGKIYSWLKKDLMPYHYVLNTGAIIMALIHFRLSWCRSTSLPEWAVLLVTLLGLSGMILKFRLIPQPLIRKVRAIHTHPAVVVGVFGLLFLGHQFLD